MSKSKPRMKWRKEVLALSAKAAWFAACLAQLWSVGLLLLFFYLAFFAIACWLVCRS
jgi:hypothetical protein